MCNHEKIVGILRNAGVDEKDKRVVANSYWGQIAKVPSDGQYTISIHIQK